MEDPILYTAITGLAISLIGELCKRYNWNVERTVLVLALLCGFVYTIFTQYANENIIQAVVSFGTQAFGIATIIYLFFIKLIKNTKDNGGN
jgi:hypothetical protein